MAMKEARVYTKVATGGVIDDDSTESLMLRRERRNNVDTFNPKAMTGFVSLATFQRTTKFCEGWKVNAD